MSTQLSEFTLYGPKFDIINLENIELNNGLNVSLANSSKLDSSKTNDKKLVHFNNLK